MSEAALPIVLGLRPDGTRLVPNAESMATITAPKGALAVIAPAPRDMVAAPGRREVASVPLDSNSDRLVLTVRASWLRNPLGRSLDEFFAWGPAGWLVGAVTAVGSTVVVARVTGGVDRAFGGLLDNLRRARPSRRSSAVHRLRRRIRPVDPGLIRRPRRRR